MWENLNNMPEISTIYLDFINHMLYKYFQMQENYIDKQVSYLFERMLYWYDLIYLLTPVTDVIYGVLKHFFKINIRVIYTVSWHAG